MALIDIEILTSHFFSLRYGEYVELCSTINKYMKVTDNILNIGCGNSKLSADLYDGGYKWVSLVVIYLSSFYY